jgi:two-component system response regulator YesN
MARILIADDEELERKALRYILQKAQVLPTSEIDEAENGAATIERATAIRYDVIFLDIKMPGIDGLEAAKILRERGIDSPIIILSAFDTFEYAQKAIRLGVYEYLLKPAGSEEVISAFRRSIERLTDMEIRARMGELSTRLLETITRQLASKNFDASVFADYEHLSDLSHLPRAAIALSIRPKGGFSQQMQTAMLKRVAFSVKGLCEGQKMSFIWGNCEDTAYLVTYVPNEESSTHPIDESFEDFLQRLLHVVCDVTSAETRIGISGPAVYPTGVLLAKANEGLALSTNDSSIVRLSPSFSLETEPWFDPAEANSGGRSLGMKALNFLKEHYMDNLTLAKVAESMNVNSSYLSHVIPKELGIGFNELLNRLRVQRAKDLISAGASIKEASFLVGFSDQAYFTRVFKRIEGEVPRRFMDKKAKKYK